MRYPNDLERVLWNLDRGQCKPAVLRSSAQMLRVMAARIVLLEAMLDDGITEAEIDAACAVVNARIVAKLAGPSTKGTIQ